MDIDPNSPFLSAKRTSVSSTSSTSKRPKLDQRFMDFNTQMNKRASRGMWQKRIEWAENDESAWKYLLEDTLRMMLGEWAAVNKQDYIQIHTLRKLEKILTEEGVGEWKIGIQRGLESRDWCGFLEQRILRVLNGTNKANVAGLGVPDQLKNAVIDAWNSEYRGTGYQVLLQAIDEVHQMPVQAHYAKVVPVTQSSGTGKSKTVDRIATERILFPLCLRENLGENYFAYPPTDAGPRRHLLAAPDAADEVQCKRYLTSFLSAIFTEARRQAEQIFADAHKISYARMAQTFYDLFKDSSWREEFYDNAISTAGGSVDNPEISFNKFEAFLKERCSDWLPRVRCPVLIGIDEIHVLFEGRILDSNPAHTLFSRLKSVLSQIAYLDFCVVFLSTATSISKLTPSTDVAPSMRERDTDLHLPVPFTELPFDVHMIADPLVSGQHDLSSVGTLEFTAKFGRPLFYATYLSRAARKDTQLAQGMMLTVREKLLGRRWPPRTKAELDPSSIAVLSARLLLDLSPAAVNARRYEEELVRSHLRMLYSVHNNLVMMTGTSPEPIIAEASAQIMNHRIPTLAYEAYMNVWGLLEEFVRDGFAAQGTIGALIGRAVSIIAMDSAIDGMAATSELKYQTPVPVNAYYKALLTDEAWNQLRVSVPANRQKLSKISGGKTFEEAFEEAYLHFSHYARANDVTPIQNRFAWAHWLRGTAILCQHNQQLTDRVHFIFFRDRGKVCPESMSVDLNQDKTSQSANPVTVSIQNAEQLGIFSNETRLPYIATVHCYALTQDEGIGVTSAETHDFGHPDSDEEAPRYEIELRGLAPYRNMTESTRNCIRSMIDESNNYIFIHHTRQYGLPLLRQMLPVLTGDPAATAWMRD